MTKKNTKKKSPAVNNGAGVVYTPGRYLVTIRGTRHTYTTSLPIEVLCDHGDGTVTIRTVKTRHLSAGYVNRVPLRSEPDESPTWERVFTPLT